MAALQKHVPAGTMPGASKAAAAAAAGSYPRAPAAFAPPASPHQQPTSLSLRQERNLSTASVSATLASTDSVGEVSPSGHRLQHESRQAARVRGGASEQGGAAGSPPCGQLLQSGQRGQGPDQQLAGQAMEAGGSPQIMKGPDLQPHLLFPDQVSQAPQHLLHAPPGGHPSPLPATTSAGAAAAAQEAAGGLELPGKVAQKRAAPDQPEPGLPRASDAGAIAQAATAVHHPSGHPAASSPHHTPHMHDPTAPPAGPPTAGGVGSEKQEAGHHAAAHSVSAANPAGFPAGRELASLLSQAVAHYSLFSFFPGPGWAEDATPVLLPMCMGMAGGEKDCVWRYGGSQLVCGDTGALRGVAWQVKCFHKLWKGSQESGLASEVF